MIKLRNILYAVTGIPVFIILIWFFAIPDNLLKDKIEDSISRSGKIKITASITGLRKGLFFNVYADRLDLKIDKTPALRITDISVRINPLFLLKKQFAVSIKGKIGTGNINGSFKLPGQGNMKIDKVEIDALPYMTSIDIKSNGFISANLDLKDDTMHVIFEIPDLNIQDSIIMIPFINSFHRVQGALSLKGNTIKVESIGLEGEKGYARIKGEITNGSMNLILELMPSADELEPVESMLIGKYQISPGYYVIPIKGSVLKF